MCTPECEHDDEKQAAIIRTISDPTYAHAENVLRRLREYEESMSTCEAIDLIHAEVVNQGDVST